MFIQLGFPGAGFHTLESFMTIMLIHEDIIWIQTMLTIGARKDRPRVSKEKESALF